MGLSETKIADQDDIRGEQAEQSSSLLTQLEHDKLQNDSSIQNHDDAAKHSCSSRFTANSSSTSSPFETSVTRNSDERSVENGAELESGKTRSLKMCVKKDFDYLVGNLEKLPESARKLFQVAKVYLTTESANSSSDRDFTSLFQTLPSTRAENDVSSGMHNSIAETHFKCPENLFIPLKKSAPLHYAQTYIQWKSAQDLKNVYAFCLPKKRTVYLQPIDEFPDFVYAFRLKTHHMTLSLFETLQGFVQIFFSGLEVYIRPPLSLKENEYPVQSRYHESTNKLQYCVNDLYPLLQSVLPSDGICIAGVIWTDIFPTGYNFVLGEASVKHQAAVISFGRYEPRGYNQDSNSDVTEVDGILMWKLLKTLSHELCHLFGLEHCKFFRCAMNESSSVSDALSHPLFLCPVCLRKLQRACGFDVLERYQQLRVFLNSVVEQLEHTSKLEESLTWLDLCIEYLNS